MGVLRAVPGALQREAITAGVAFLSLVNQLLEHWKVRSPYGALHFYWYRTFTLIQHLDAWSAGWPGCRLTYTRGICAGPAIAAALSATRHDRSMALHIQQGRLVR